MTKKSITDLYRAFRKKNDNLKPNRVIVRMHWEDEPENSLVDTLGIVPLAKIGCTEDIPGDAIILFYASSIDGIYQLTKPDNGSEFVVDEILEFYRVDFHEYKPRGRKKNLDLPMEF